MAEDVELTQKRIYLKAEKTKGRKDKVVYFSDKTEFVLRIWLKFKDRYVDSEYIFLAEQRKVALTCRRLKRSLRKI